MADGGKSESIVAPMLLSVGAIVLIIAMMAGIATLKPLEFKPVPAATCEGEACTHEGAPPVSSEHEAAPPASGAHEAAPPHGE